MTDCDALTLPRVATGLSPLDIIDRDVVVARNGTGHNITIIALQANIHDVHVDVDRVTVVADLPRHRAVLLEWMVRQLLLQIIVIRVVHRQLRVVTAASSHSLVLWLPCHLERCVRAGARICESLTGSIVLAVHHGRR